MTASLRVRIGDVYVARKVLIATVATWAVLVGFDVLTAFASELDEVGEGGYSLGHAVLAVLYTVPRRLYEVFPTVAVIGCLLGLGGLASRSELTAMAALGISRLRIGGGALLCLLALALAMVLNMETLAPAAEQQAQAVVRTAKTGELIVARYSGLWAREGRVFLNARTGERRYSESGDWTELQDVRLYEFDEQGRLLSLATARTAEHRGAGWVLKQVRRTKFAESGVSVSNVAEEQWRSQLDDEALAVALARPRYLSSGELSTHIDYLRRNGLDPGEFESTYWGRWFYPVNVIVLCLATLPFAFGSLRSGGFGKRLFFGIVFGIAFILLQRLAVSLADVYRFDVRWAMVLPPLALLLGSYGLARRLR